LVLTGQARQTHVEGFCMSGQSGLVPPLKWHGGKHYVAPKVIDLMPRHLHYVEPYFGGGQVLFRRDPADPRLRWDGLTSDGRKADGVSEVVNDIDGDLMNFYSVLKDPERFEQLRHLLDLTQPSEAEWEAARDLLASPGDDTIQRAAALFSCCRLSLAGRMKGFSPTERTRLRGGRNGGANAWQGAIAGLEAVHRRLKDVWVLRKDAVEVIASEDTSATLFYCDPPYLHETRTARKVYHHEMTEADHRKLLDALRSCKGKVILSGYANPLYDDALRGWARYVVERPNNAAGGKVKRRMAEVIWCNYRAE
jgi:DNA adenine methylase